MKKIKVIFLSLASSFGAMAADIDVTPGQLESLWKEGGKGEQVMRLKGAIDARDLATLENLSADVETLDLSQVSIRALSSPNRKYFGRTLFSQGEIPSYTFFKSQVKVLVLPPDITSIGEGAFAGSAISAIVIPEGITRISDYAFYGCPNLTEVVLPASISEIGKGAFGNCTSLESIDLSNTSVSSIPERAFAGDVKLSTLRLPLSLASIGREAFSHTAVKTLDLRNVGRYEAFALSGMPFLEVLSINPDADISDGLLMDNISLASLTGMPVFVPDYFAANCSSIPTESINSASTLGRYSFANTMAPTELVLSGFITKIERGALAGLGTIRSIDATALEGRVPEVDEYSFEGLPQAKIQLVVSSESFDLWKQDPYWSLFDLVAEGETGIQEIEDAAATARLAIKAERGFVIIESDSAVTDVRIYTTDGRVAFIASPNEPRVEIAAESLPSGIVVVSASDETGRTKTASLLMN